MSKKTDDDINAQLKAQGLGHIEVEGYGEGKNGGSKRVIFNATRGIDGGLLEKAVASGDELTAVILWNLEIEHQLSLFIQDLLGEKLKQSANYDALTLMLKMCRFENDIYGVVNGFRKLRNKFAHNKNMNFEKCKSLVEEIVACRLPAPVDYSIYSVGGMEKDAEMKRIDSLDSMPRLAVFANMAIIFLVSAKQLYNYPKPFKPFAIVSSYPNDVGE